MLTDRNCKSSTRLAADKCAKMCAADAAVVGPWEHKRIFLSPGAA